MNTTTTKTFTAEQQEYALKVANLLSRGPAARVAVNDERSKMQIEVALPGEGDEWDENEIELQNDLIE